MSQPEEVPRPEAGEGHQPVIGFVRPEKTALDPFLMRWESDLRRRGKKGSRSPERYRGRVQSLARQWGWTDLGHLRGPELSQFIAEKFDSGEWAATTGDQCISTFRSFGDYLVNVEKALPSNPFGGVHGTGEESDPDVRAGTAAEWEAIIAAAHMEYRASRKFEVDHAPFITFLCYTGFRPGIEARHVEARDIDLAKGIVWADKRFAKNRKTMPVPLHPVLREVLERVVREHPEGPLFPTQMSNPVWHSFRERAGIAYRDERGLKFCPKSARAWYSTTLDMACTPRAVHARLIRHLSTLADRHYNDPPKDSEVLALNGLPDLLPSLREKLSCIAKKPMYDATVTTAEDSTVCINLQHDTLRPAGAPQPGCDRFSNATGETNGGPQPAVLDEKNRSMSSRFSDGNGQGTHPERPITRMLRATAAQLLAAADAMDMEPYSGAPHAKPA